MERSQRHIGADSIGRRLMMSFMLTTGLALTLASSAYFVAQYYDARATLIEHVGTMARLLGENAGPWILFGYREEAESTLTSLQAEPTVVAGILFDEDGKPFARYLRHGETQLPDVGDLDSQPVVRDGHVDLFERVEIDGGRIGTVFIRAEAVRLEAMARTYLMIFGIVTTAALLVCYVGARILRRQIAGPLGALVDGSARMAEGDLSVHVAVHRDDELGLLAETFNHMVASLRDLVAKVGENSNALAQMSQTLSDSSGELAAEVTRQENAVTHTAESVEAISGSIRDVNESVESLAHNATDSSAAVLQMDRSIAEVAGHMDSLAETIDGTASSVVEMTGAIREIARIAEHLGEATVSTTSALGLLGSAVSEVESNAKESHDLSDQTAEQAALGSKSVQQTVEGMLEIQTSFQALERTISQLNVKSESIGEVVKVIEGVVEQTNLLALNAAIISSQAGEHGRAFAVVADEVRSLAERTAGSTREITELIESVQGGVAAAVAAMHQGNERVRNGVALSRQAGEILRVIGDSAKTSSECIHDIVRTTARQSGHIDKVEQALAQLGVIAQQLGRGTHEQDNASAEITRGVERMRELGQRVKRSTQEQSKESNLITQSVEVVAEQVKQILEATTEQSAQAEQILQALQVFREVTIQSSQRGHTLHQSVDELSDQSRSLEEEVGRFRVGDEAGEDAEPDRWA